MLCREWLHPHRAVARCRMFVRGLDDEPNSQPPRPNSGKLNPLILESVWSQRYSCEATSPIILYRCGFVPAEWIALRSSCWAVRERMAATARGRRGCLNLSGIPCEPLSCFHGGYREDQTLGHYGVAAGPWIGVLAPMRFVGFRSSVGRKTHARCGAGLEIPESPDGAKAIGGCPRQSLLTGYFARG